MKRCQEAELKVARGTGVVNDGGRDKRGGRVKANERIKPKVQGGKLGLV